MLQRYLMILEHLTDITVETGEKGLRGTQALASYCDHLKESDELRVVAMQTSQPRTQGSDLKIFFGIIQINSGLSQTGARCRR